MKDLFLFMLKCFVLIIVTAASLYPQIIYNDPAVEHLTLKDGLSQSTITCIYQDSQGFMWFGTANGLNRYDGYGFTVYKSNILDSGSISNNIINYISEDRKGRLWIATENGINAFDKRTGKFKRYLMDSAGGRFMPVLEEGDQTLWAGGFGGGLFKLNLKDGSFKRYLNDTAVSDNSKDFIWCAAKDNKGNILLGTYHGLVVFDPLKEKFTDYPINTTTSSGTSGKRIFSMLQDGNSLWIGTESGILDRFNSETGEFTHHSLESGGTKYRGRISAILNYGLDRLLISVMGGDIIVFNKLSGQVESKINNLTDKQIYSLFIDKTGIIWGGTFTSGLNKINPAARKFNLHSRTTANNLSSPFVNAIFKDSEGVTWIGTTDGLNKYNAESDSYTVFKINANNGTSNIFSVSEGDKGYLWIGSASGLHKFSKSSGEFNSYNQKTGISSSVTLLFNYKDNLLVCSRGEGIKVLNTLTGEKKSDISIDYKEFSNIRISAAAAGEDGTLWFGGSDGAIKLTPERKLIHYKYERGEKKLSSSNVLSLCLDKEGILWIGTYGGGLNRMDKEGNITWFSEPEGLPDNVIYGILSDGKGYLWLSTNRGICRFNTFDNSIKTYDLSDGLQGLEFNGGASFKSIDGEMFFGGLEGWNSFYPDQVTEDPDPPSLVITGMKILDENYSFSSDTPVELSYDQNFISFDFVALHYSVPLKNQYAYMLKGFDKEWIYSGGRRFASYTNLEPGEYTFLVKGSNNDGIWNEQPASVSFIIAPPFWQTWWFYLLAVFTIGAGAVSIHKYRVKLKLKQIQKIEEIRKRIADDFHDELGHKLTKISLYSEIMKKELSGTLNGHEEYLQKISDAANNLYDDTKDFIWSIDPVKDSLFDLAVYLKDFGDEFFERTGISFIVNEIPEEFKRILLPMNWKRQLALIFKEGMNNILKHSACTEVTLAVESINEKLKISLKDNGRGFKEDEIKRTARGIEIMKGRAGKIGGQLDISGSDSGGIEMIFTCELKKEKSK